MNISLPSWDELAPRLAAQGYQPLPIERSEIEHYGREHPTGGGWAYGLEAPGDTDGITAGVLCGRLPIEGGSSRAECEATRIAAVQLTVRSNINLAASLESIVREHVGAIGPVRISNDDAGLLLPFRISEDARAFAGQTGLHIDAINHVSVGSAGTCFLVDGWKYGWRDGVSLVDVPRADLPAIASHMLRPLILACEDYLQSLQPPAPKTERQLQLEARVAHRLACGTCALCVDGVAVDDWVKVDGSDKRKAKITAVADAKGEFHINLDGTVYRAHGHRLFPVPAPVAEPKPHTPTMMIGARYSVPL